MELLVERIKEFNRRLDVVIKANFEQDFVISKEEQTIENLQAKLSQLKGTRHPLQNKAVAYLNNHIFELRMAETENNIDISQPQEKLENLIAIFKKLEERKKQLEMKKNQEETKGIQLSREAKILKDVFDSVEPRVRKMLEYFTLSKGFDAESWKDLLEKTYEVLDETIRMKYNEALKKYRIVIFQKILQNISTKFKNMKKK